MLVITILIGVLVVTINAEHYQQYNQIQHCGDLKPQQWVEVDKLLGKWFATEVIFHDKEETEVIKNSSECPVLFLAEILQDRFMPSTSFMDNSNYREDYKQHTGTQEENLDWDELMKPLIKIWKNASRREHNNNNWQTSTLSPEDEYAHFKNQTLQRLRLVWHENGSRLEYSLRYNVSRPGYWMSFGSQNDSMNNQNPYTEFIGTIQLLKAVRTHTVLTFCHISTRHQFFSVVMSREPWVNKTDLEHIHNMLQRKQLPIRHVRRMCKEYRNDAMSLHSRMILLIFSVCLVLSRYRIANS